MTVSHLIQSYRDKREVESLQYQQKREQERPKEVFRRASIIGHLEYLGATNIRENGYVFRFVLGDRYYCLCDQDSRVVGDSWILQPPEEQSFLEDNSEWNSHFTKDHALCAAVGYRDEMQSVQLANWHPL